MATAAQPLQSYLDPNTGEEIDPTTGLPVQQSQAQQGNYLPANPNAPVSASDNFTGVNPGALPTSNGANADQGGFYNGLSSGQQFASNRMNIEGQGQGLENTEGAAQGYFGGNMTGYQQAADTAYSDLSQQPGYTPGQAAQIDTDYSQFNTPASALQQQYLTPDEQASIAGDPNIPVTTAIQGTQAEANDISQLQGNTQGQLNNYSGALTNATGAYGAGVSGAENTLGSGLQSAQGGFDALNTAVNNPGLAFDPNQTEQQFSNADVTNLENQAAESVGANTQAQQQRLQLGAAAQGNTDPLAIAAAEQQIQQSGAIASSEAETNAALQGEQTQFGQASSIEGQREAAANTQTGYRAGAATTEEAAAQSAAGLTGTQDISAAEATGQAGINAANTYFGTDIAAQQGVGEYAAGAQSGITGQQTAAETTAQQQETGAAQYLAANQQATTQNIQNTQYAQGTGSAQLTAAGATNVGQTALSGEQQYRNYLTGAQAQGQAGYLGEGQLQNTTYGTQTSGINAASQGQAYNAQTGPTPANYLQAVSGFFAEGDVVTKPTVGIVGERGPEMILKLNPNKPAPKMRARYGVDPNTNSSNRSLIPSPPISRRAA